MLEKFFEGNYHWIVVIIIAFWLLDKLRPDYENKKEKAKRLKEEALKNTQDVKRILKDEERYDKNPILYYRALEENGFPDQIKELKEDIKFLLNE